jgi:plasmid maintenance system killer protein
MRVLFAARFHKHYRAAPRDVQHAVDKQIVFLAKNLRHPSLHAKKYDEAEGVWQARVNQDWRFYFIIKGDAYILVALTPHPK